MPDSSSKQPSPSKQLSPSQLAKLEQIIHHRKTSPKAQSYTSSLLQGDFVHCVRKFAEESMEVVLAATTQERQDIIEESADMLYHWLVLLAAKGISLQEVENALQAREKK